MALRRPKTTVSVDLQNITDEHIFPKALVTVNKMEPKRRNHSWNSFCTLEHGVVRFVPCFLSRNHFLTGQNSLFKKVITNQTRKGIKTSLENIAFTWVPFCLRSLGPFEICGKRCNNACNEFRFQEINDTSLDGRNSETKSCR